MDMTKDKQTEYVPMQELTDTIKYTDIQPSPYESPYQQDIYQEQGTYSTRCLLTFRSATAASFSKLCVTVILPHSLSLLRTASTATTQKTLNIYRKL